jgi:hypothetical protein
VIWRDSNAHSSWRVTQEAEPIFFENLGDIIINRRDLNTQEGFDNFLEDVEDTLEDFNFDDSVKTYALVPPGVKMKAPGVSRQWDNCGFGDGLSAAHEMGHLFGLDHAPCGNANGVDPDFQPLDGTIGNVGVAVIDVVKGAIVGDFRDMVLPHFTYDLMSYCATAMPRLVYFGGHWISVYSYLIILNNMIGG